MAHYLDLNVVYRGWKLEGGSCCGCGPWDEAEELGSEAQAVTQAAQGAAFQKALAVKCQGCLSRRFPPCLFLPYHPHRKTEREQKNKPECWPSWLCY